ncbi:MAG: TonB family protein [Saprospiraceae bacterium]|nr:TonB family protein [Saprospiraceae bacterium]
MALHHREIKDLLKKLTTGTISEQERLRLRHQASDDPFLQDAVEGYETLERDQSSHLTELKQRVGAKAEKFQPRSKSHFWRIAASVALLITTGGLMYFGSQRELGSNSNLKEITFETAHGGSESPSVFDPGSDSGTLAIADEVPSSLKNETLQAPEERPEKSQDSRTNQTKMEETTSLFSEAESTIDQIAPEAKILASATPPMDGSSQKEVSQITGRIFDDIGNPLIGANIRPLSGEQVATSDVEGRFTMDSTATRQGLEITYAGFETRQIVPITPNEMDSIILDEDQQSLSDMVEINSKKITGNPNAAARSSEAQYSKLKTNTSGGPAIGWSKYLAYIEQNRKMPNAALNAGISGSVELSFFIDHQGRPQDIKILKSLGYGCDTEAIRLLQQGPAWYPLNSPTDSTKLSIDFK